MITREEVLSAYQFTGIKPAPRLFYKGVTEPCACPLGVLIYRQHGCMAAMEVQTMALSRTPVVISEQVGQLLGIHPCEVQQFIRGFDGEEFDEDADMEAYVLGEQLRRELLG